MMVPKKVYILGIICLCLVEGLPNHEYERTNDSQFQRNITTDTEVELHRHKRGWGSVLFTGLSVLVKTTSLGLTLGAAISGGCIYYPSICSNKKEIERLDNLIKGMTAQYEQEYVLAKQSYYDLKQVTTNNGYISFYINDTMQIVETLQQIEENLAAELENKLPLLAQMFEASRDNITFEQYLQAIIGNLEYRLSDLNKMLLQHKQNALIGVVVQYVVEATLNKFVKSFKNAYTHVTDDHIISTTHASLWERMEGADDVATPKIGAVKKIKLVPKALRQMAKNFGQSFRDFGKSVKKWGRIKNWKGFKGKLAHTFRKPIQKLKNVKAFFTDPVARQKFVKGYRLSWSERIMTGIGIVADVISQYVQVKEWEKVATQMEKAKNDYREYYQKLDKNLKEINAEKANMSILWNETIDIFESLSLPFRSLVENATKYNNFSDVVGIGRLPVNYAQSPLFTIDFDHMNKKSLSSNQHKVISFLKEIHNNMSVIEDKMRARLVLYNNTATKSETNETVADILSDVTSILQFSPSMTMKHFGQQLTSKDLVCTVSILRFDIPEYDFFPLDTFRPRCEVNDSTFETLKREALVKRKSQIMRDVILRNVKNGGEESLSKLVDAVHNTYSGVSDKTIAAFGSSLTKRDIVCALAQEFPARLMYDFINLSRFHNGCSSITTGEFNKLIHDADKLRELSKGIKNNLKTCHDFKFCPCLSQVAKTYHVTEPEVSNLLKHLNPNWQPNPAAQFCGPNGCGCVHL